ncbi:hypothetical protein O5O45_06235 [Hahella aquimaris]|uniref:hypothetical protein n=1 Tax=Hahella sp. HNIBRBA332 TaxID=3015983 RepID=UPI00273C84BC|nr:hypothetical protein [Hahella sp. HNIBRBA332]WLQ15517.1 hypothetical protein O5O45_06235 [Hahella sp. HNIBRBA332]
MPANFTSRDLHYNGIDRRSGPRRINTDRRTSVRFEPGNPDRRQIAGRRAGEIGGWARTTL